MMKKNAFLPIMLGALALSHHVARAGGNPAPRGFDGNSAPGIADRFGTGSNGNGTVTPEIRSTREVPVPVIRYGGIYYAYHKNPDGMMRCAEVTLQGRFVDWADTGARCREAFGSFLDWRDNGKGRMQCAKITPEGGIIDWESGIRCREVIGLLHEWRNDGGRMRCAEVTGQGGFIDWSPSRQRCNGYTTPP